MPDAQILPNAQTLPDTGKPFLVPLHAHSGHPCNYMSGPHILPNVAGSVPVYTGEGCHLRQVHATVTLIWSGGTVCKSYYINKN